MGFGPVVIGLRVDEVARGSYFDTFAGRGGQSTNLKRQQCIMDRINTTQLILT